MQLQVKQKREQKEVTYKQTNWKQTKYRVTCLEQSHKEKIYH